MQGASAFACLMPEETKAAAKPSRPWYRWGRATYCVAALVAAVLVFFNVPGEIVFTPDLALDGKYGPHFEFTDDCLHGWPATYLRREAGFLQDPPYWEMWNLLEGVEEFSALSLFSNAAVAVLVAFLAGTLFEIWRRRRRRLYHLHLIDLLILVSVLAVCGAVYSANRAEFRAEQAVLRSIEESQDPIVKSHIRIEQLVDWQLGGPSWLRHRGIDAPFAVLDRVMGAEATGEELEEVRRLHNLRVVRIVGPASNRQLQLLEELPNLQALDMSWVDVDDEGVIHVDDDGVWLKEYFRLPNLPRLRGLNLYDTPFCGEGLENIPAIETLDLSGTDVDDHAAQKLAGLHQLRNLCLEGTKVSDDGLRHLSGLKNLEHLHLGGVSDRGLRHLAPLAQLRSLRFYGEDVTDESVPLLKRFTHLEYLEMTGSSLSEEAKAELGATIPDCFIP